MAGIFVEEKVRHTQEAEKDNVFERARVVPSLWQVMRCELCGYNGQKTRRFERWKKLGMWIELTVYRPGEVHIESLE